MRDAPVNWAAQPVLKIFQRNGLKGAAVARQWIAKWSKDELAPAKLKKIWGKDYPV